MELVLNGEGSPTQLGALMAILRIKEESAEELAAFASVLCRYSQRVELDLPHLIDICVPYDGRAKSPILILAAAFIAAGCGVYVGLHGRSEQKTGPKFGIGIGDIWASLNIPHNLSLEAAAQFLQETGVAYVDAAQFAPLEQFNEIRRDYGMRSFFNTIEKLMNPFGAKTALLGIFHGPVLMRVAQAMQSQYERGVVVQGPEGSIEILTSRRSQLVEFNRHQNDELVEWVIDPALLGWWEKIEDAPAELTAASNAELTELLINPSNQTSQLEIYRHSTLMTAALMIYSAGKAESFGKALTLAETSLNNGAAQKILTTLRQTSLTLNPIC
jgi:anthranilate phosphoribosyltransferase